MAGSGVTLSAERRVVTALFCDVVGSSSIAESMDPEDWGDLVGGAIQAMGSVVARYGGTVTEFGGDGILALFGAPAAHEDDPYRAVRTGMEIITDLQHLPDAPLDVRVGIHTGLVVVGDIDAGAVNTYSALGDTVNVAARIQGVADPGTVVVSAETRRLLGGDVDVELLGPAELKGRVEPVMLHRVVSVREADERRRGLRDLSSPMVGRIDELATLTRLTTMSAAGTGRVAAILGEPGVGKSRLVRELLGALAPDTLVATGVCLPYDVDLPHHLAASLVLSIAGVGGGESPEVVRKAVGNLADRLQIPERTETLHRLVGLEGDYPELTPEELQTTFAAALFEVVATAAPARTPAVLVCEDAHWADASSVALVADLVERIPSLPVLLLIVMRPDTSSNGWALLERARRDVGQALTELDLPTLDQGHSRELVSNLLEIESIPDQLRALILDKAEGNPFFIEEIVRMLVDGGMVEHQEGRWVGTQRIEELEVPETIHGLLASRIDLLDRQLRRAGRVAAVIGRVFSSRLFDVVYDDRPRSERESLHPHLAALEARGMVRVAELEPELVFGFRHALIHDVMYEGLLKKERRQIHRAAASAIEELYPDRIEEMAAALARHHSEAGAAESAIEYYMIAARRGMANGARVEAAHFFEEAQHLLESEPGASARSLVEAVLGRVTAASGFMPYTESVDLIEDVLATAAELDDPDLLARLYERAVWARGMQGESLAHPAYRRQVDDARALLPRLKDAGNIALLGAMTGMVFRSDDEFEASLEPLVGAVKALEAQGRITEASFHAAMLADSYSQLGRFDEAVEAVERARDLGERSGDPNTILDADIIQGSIAADRGDLEDALSYTQRGIAGAEAHDNTFCNLAGNFKLADQQLRLGDVDSAISHLEKSTELAEYCDAGLYEAMGRAWLAMARSRSGDLRPEDFEQPLRSAVEAGSRSSEGLVRLQRAVALAGSADVEGARPDFERAIELFSSYGGLPNLGRAHHAYGQALEAGGFVDESVSHLKRAEEIFGELGIRPDPVSTS